ncbi:hypothetical protein G7046_g8901 [Stylonectria norvegica]|nr:hypothetical protein G7046_g8901 [Stylonectria norvegica]
MPKIPRGVHPAVFPPLAQYVLNSFSRITCICTSSTSFCSLQSEDLQTLAVGYAKTVILMDEAQPGQLLSSNITAAKATAKAAAIKTITACIATATAAEAEAKATAAATAAIKPLINAPVNALAKPLASLK